MRDFLIENGQLIAVAVSGIEVFLTLILLIIFFAKKKAAIFLMFLIALGIAFDACVTAFGASFSESLLDVLSKVRYIAHGLLLPLTITICGYLLNWEYSIGIKICWILSVLVGAGGAAAGYFRDTALTTFADITRYAPTDNSPDWAEMVGKYVPIAMVLLLIITGVSVLIRQKNVCILLGGLCMFGFSLLGPITGNADMIFLISMFGEMLLLFFYMLYSLTGFKEEKFF